MSITINKFTGKSGGIFIEKCNGGIFNIKNFTADSNSKADIVFTQQDNIRCYADSSQFVNGQFYLLKIKYSLGEASEPDYRLYYHNATRTDSNRAYLAVANKSWIWYSDIYAYPSHPTMNYPTWNNCSLIYIQSHSTAFSEVVAYKMPLAFSSPSHNLITVNSLNTNNSSIDDANGGIIYLKQLSEINLSPYKMTGATVSKGTIDVSRFQDGEWYILKAVGRDNIEIVSIYRHLLNGLKNSQINTTALTSINIRLYPTNESIENSPYLEIYEVEHNSNGGEFSFALNNCEVYKLPIQLLAHNLNYDIFN
jgi:hypothetical protein